MAWRMSDRMSVVGDEGLVTQGRSRGLTGSEG